MKIHQLLLLLLLGGSLQPAAQSTAYSHASALVGTWKYTTDSLEEIKIISPTHVFFYTRNTKGDTLAHTGAGTYTTNGNKYVEYMQYGNFETKGLKAEYNYEVGEDQFRQYGVLTLGDGTSYDINETYTRVKADQEYNGAHVGTWNQLSSSFTTEDGTKGSHTNATHIRYQIITPTHWMRISMANGQFENAFGGIYTMEGDKISSTVDFGSMPGIKGTTVEITQRIDGNKMYWSGKGKSANGSGTFQFNDVFERVAAPAGNRTAAQ